MSDCVTKGQAMEGIGTIEQSEGAHGAAFVGSFTHALDPKKRLTIPADWREQVTDGRLYVLPDINDRCLGVLPASEMMYRIRKMRQHGVTDRKARFFARVLASQSDLVTWDSQGRIRIKDELLERAMLTDQVVLVGAFDRFELWNPELFREVGPMDGDSLKDAAQYVGF